MTNFNYLSYNVEVNSVMAVPILLHGSEFWAANIIKDWMTIQAAEMKC
jgi:hypothetical protein